MLSPEERTELVKEISVPFDYSASRINNKGLKTKIFKSLDHWFKVPLDKVQRIQALAKRLSVCVLMLDDIQDNSALRCGHKTAHEVYGVSKTMLALTFGLCKFYESNAEIANADVASKVVKALFAPISGQGLDVYWRDNFVCPTFDEYTEMVELKTGAGFFPLLYLFEHFSESNAKAETYFKVFNMIAVFFQIDNDLDSLTSTEFMAEKGFCEDISEGKFSFPLIHAIQARPEDKLIFNAMKSRTTDVDLKKRCVALMEELGSFTFAKTKMMELETEIRKEIERLSGNDILNSLLDEYHAKIN